MVSFFRSRVNNRTTVESTDHNSSIQDILLVPFSTNRMLDHQSAGHFGHMCIGWVEHFATQHHQRRLLRCIVLRCGEKESRLPLAVFNFEIVAGVWNDHDAKHVDTRITDIQIHIVHYGKANRSRSL